jgi:histidyl-tRNA synthetase
LQLEVSIARGLDYYTGSIFETFLSKLPSIGSVCSGGRYDDLAGLFTKQSLPGIGASLGLDRLLAAMQELKMIPPVRTMADVMIIHFDRKDLHDYFRLANELRSAGWGVEVYPDPKKLDHQFKYADRNGYPAVIVAGPDELKAGRVKLKWLASGEQVDLARQEIGGELSKRLR